MEITNANATHYQYAAAIADCIVLFSVDTLEEWVQEGMPFREAYGKMKKMIETGAYTPNRDVPHTHLGSRGNLALEALTQKMDSLLW